MEKRLKVAKLRTPGRHADGNNLYLNIRQTPTGTISRAWAAGAGHGTEGARQGRDVSASVLVKILRHGAATLS